jgi:MFS transporter, ACS family, solute carrier family 17 (sodium-dependent inorganic phosphate cotransporter), other
MGTITAYLLSPAIMDSLGGWRSLFYVYGAAGLVVLVPWIILAKDSPILYTDQQTHNIRPDLESKLDVTVLVSVVESSKDDGRAPWRVIFRSRGVWAMLMAHCARNWGLYNTLAWTPTFYAQEYNIGVRESAILSVLPSVAAAVGGFIAGLSADAILRRMQQEMSHETHDVARTNVRKIFQGISLFGSAASLAVLALNIPEEPWVSQTFLTASLGLLSFSAAGFDAAIQDKAGKRWAGLLYSVSTLPAVISKFCIIKKSMS